MDPDNPVVRLCAQGMEAEADGRPEDALRSFEQAWLERADDFDACVAAHYVARHQESAEETLRWNEISLKHADAVGDERVLPFYPSLHVNLGASCELLGDPDEARRHFELAAGRVHDLPEGPYGDMLRQAVEDGLSRLGGASPPPGNAGGAPGA